MPPPAHQVVDALLCPRWVLPIAPVNTALTDHSVAIDQGRIVGIFSQAQAAAQLSPRRRVELPEHALLPGLINAHGHAAMSLFRGMADDKPLHAWLQEDIWPAERRWVGPEFVRDGAALAVAEMLLGGTTCFSDMYFFPEVVAKVAVEAGMRCQLAFPVLDFATVWGSGPDDYLRQGTALFDEYRNQPLIATAFGPHAPYTVSRKTLERVATLSEELQANVQMHVHESTREVDEALSGSGRRPLAMLREIGLLNPRMQCVHATQLDGDDIGHLAETGSHVIHCPESNLKLASGMCPVAALQRAGVNVALGTDGAASNNDLDMFGELRTAALLAKGMSGDATALPAAEALALATINGARALGLEHCLGSLEAGKWADIIAVDLSDLRLQPVYNPLAHLVYNQVSHRVSHVWVAGQACVEAYRLRTLDHQTLRRRAQRWASNIHTAGYQ